MATKRAPTIAMICSDFTQGSRVSKGSLFLNFRQISIHVKRGLLLPFLKAINSFFLENEIIQKLFFAQVQYALSVRNANKAKYHKASNNHYEF